MRSKKKPSKKEQLKKVGFALSIIVNKNIQTSKK
jgi:hypothetical protein